MKLVILAGGLGSRISEETSNKPKPMVKIGGKPIIWHIIKFYNSYGIKEIYIAAGYKHNFIRSYFQNNKIKNNKIRVINTGLKSMTGLRIKKLEKFLKNDDNFCLTYGDGLSDVNIKKLINFHKNHKKIATLSAVRPPARFGKMKIKGNLIVDFREKSQLDEGRINGGFFVLSKKIFSLISGKKNAIFEVDVLPKLAKKNQLCAFKHNGNWQCMDTLREKKILNKHWKKNPFWKLW